MAYEGFGLECWLMLVGLPALLELESLPVHRQDVYPVSKAVQQSAGQPFRAKDLGPLVEWQVGDDQGRALRINLNT